MSKRWPAWIWIPLCVTLLLLLSSGFVGLTDDEAYYWVLAQKPALGYAYHPPMVAWFIALSQWMLGWFFGAASTWVVRIPSCLSIGAVFLLSLKWIAKGMEDASAKALAVPSLLLLSFAGLMGLGWMMVPDVPLFLGWMLCFVASWELTQEQSVSNKYYWILSFGIFLATLGKISSVLIVFSAIVSVLINARGRTRALKALAFILLGFALALVPICIWNAQHDWSAILYQIKERHADSDISLKRYLRFWLIELFAAGPVLLIYTIYFLFRGLFARSRSEIERFVAIWILPAAVVYCIQPLFSDFKPHWAFVVWWPGALLLAWQASRRKVRFSTFQIFYGLSIVTLVWISMNFLVLGRFVSDPKMDVTNDLYGWRLLPAAVAELPAADRDLPIVGSRYQTASQAAFAMGGLTRVTMLPRDIKARDEWSTLPISKGVGPEWPALTQAVLFVTDNRYDAPAEFPNASCTKAKEILDTRSGFTAKQIWIWKCILKNS
jgi:hypothetical protein